jgi:hypothetical protein
MKILLTILFLVSSIWAADKAAMVRALAACGPDAVQLDVTTHKIRPPVAAPAAGKALVYLIQDQWDSCLGCTPTTRAGLDGAWVGANHGSSFFSFPVEPGEHHLCTDWQNDLPDSDRVVALASFTAQAGKTYYFHAGMWRNDDTFWLLKLEPLDPDEGLLLVAGDGFKFSTSRTVK